MKIVLNAASAKMGGALSYLTNLLRNLPPQQSEYQFFVYLPGETARRLTGLPANIQLCPVPDEDIGGGRRVWWEQITLRRLLRKMKVDLLFSTANFAMFRCPVKQILLVRNALYFSRMYQQTLLPRHGLKMRIAFRLRRWMICQSAKSADIVMTPTHAMLNALQTHVQVAATKGIVNHYGVGELVEGKMAHRSIERQSSPVRLLYISLYAEHKNLTTLLKALPLLNRDRNQEFSLKTTVNPNWDAASRMLTHKDDIDLARLPDITPWVKFAGPLSQEEIEEQYRTADIFVFPSITESFGHPMAEAMAHGLPIVAADTPVNREMCGNAALYFSPFEPDELAQAIHRVATDPPLGRSLGLEGKRRARTMFRWDTHVRRILEIAQGTQQEVLQESCQDSLTQQREECLLAPTVTNRPV